MLLFLILACFFLSSIPFHQSTIDRWSNNKKAKTMQIFYEKKRKKKRPSYGNKKNIVIIIIQSIVNLLLFPNKNNRNKTCWWKHEKNKNSVNPPLPVNPHQHPPEYSWDQSWVLYPPAIPSSQQMISPLQPFQLFQNTYFG